MIKVLYDEKVLYDGYEQTHEKITILLFGFHHLLAIVYQTNNTI